MTNETYDKPVPEPTVDSAPFWAGLEQHRLLLQKCAGCGRIRHYPRPMCDACYSTAVNWIEASGRGKVHSWTITHHAFVPGFRDEVPYVLATVDLDEGVRMNAQLRGVEPATLRIGLPVRVDYERARAGLTLPVLRAEASA